MQSPILVGRDGHLELAEARLADAAAGHGSTVLLAGEAGIGKSRLVGAIMRRARAQGFTVVKGDLAPADEGVPAGVMLEFARTMRDQPALAPTGDAIAAHWRDATDGGRATYSRTLVLDVVDLLRSVIGGPTLFVFEDLQWADDLSLELIGELARLADRHPLLLVGVYRRDEAQALGPLRAWRSRLLTQRLAEEVRLERLTVAETATMTTLLLGTGLPAARDVVAAIQRRSDGVPLHVEELIAATRARGSVDVGSIHAVDIPDTIEDAILERVARMSPEARRTGQAAAVLGRCFVPDVLAGILDVPVSALDAPLEELVDHAVLYPYGVPDVGFHDFRHQLLREALYRSTSERDRRRYHARAAEFGTRLEGTTDVHTSVHFAAAGMHAEAYRAALSGAAAAVRVSAHREAFELYARAVDQMPGELPAMERAELLERFSDEAGAIERNAVAEQALMQARAAYLEAGRPDLAASMLGAVQTYWRREGRPLQERRAIMEEARAELLALPAGPARDQRLRWLHFDDLVLAVDANDLDEAARRLSALLDAVHGTDDAWLELDGRIRGAMASVIGGDVRHGLDAMLRFAAEARAKDSQETGVTAFRDTAVLAARVMDYATAAVALGEGLAYADSIQQSHCAHVMAALVAEVHWAAGRWDEALIAGRQAIADPGCSRAPAMARCALGFVALGRGDREGATADLNAALAFGDRSEMIEFRLPPRWGLAETALLAGDHVKAIVEVEAARALAEAVGERALFIPFLVTGVRAYQQAGRVEDAERWFRAAAAYLEPTPALGRAALAHAEGLVALASGSTGIARRELAAAVEGWDAVGRVWEASWARLDLATAFLRTNRFASAVSLAGQVLGMAATLDSPALQARAEDIVRHGRGRVVDAEPWHPLTTREFEVARLVGAGLTNAEIAEQLGIAPKTASSHIEHILAKLGASRRAEIATWASHVEHAAAGT
ncbi:MAG: helix-turn-helix transcriptional regulator [Candidatus Limnocylindrales bacterium]